MRHRVLFLLMLALPVSAGCLQKLDPNLAAGGAVNLPAPAVTACPAGDGFACHFEVRTTTTPVGLTADADGNVVDSGSDPCAKVNQDALSLLTTKCVPCHTPSTPPLNFITDFERLIAAASPTPSYAPNPRYVVPGKPEESLIYIRAAINKDMPLQNPLAPSNGLTVSESSVLREWIASCVPGAKPPTGSGGMPGAGGGGSGGATTLDAGGSGTGGASAGSGTGGLSATSGTGGVSAASGTGGVSAASGTGGASAASGTGGASAASGTGGGLAGGGSAAAGDDGVGEAGGSAGTAGGPPARPCAGLCDPPTVYTLDQQYNTPPVGTMPGCYETVSVLTELTCRNCDRRALRINGGVVNASAGTPVSLAGVMTRGGGYCIQLAANNPAANFSVR